MADPLDTLGFVDPLVQPMPLPAEWGATPVEAPGSVVDPLAAAVPASAPAVDPLAPPADIAPDTQPATDDGFDAAMAATPVQSAGMPEFLADVDPNAGPAPGSAESLDQQTYSPMPWETPEPGLVADDAAVTGDAEQLYGQGSRAVATAGEERKVAGELVDAQKISDVVDEDLAEQDRAIHRFREAQTDANIQTAKYEQRKRELERTEIDNENWFKTRHPLQTLAAFFAVAGSGFLNPRGQNQALQTILGYIDDDIETQKANLAHKRSMLGETRDSISDQIAKNRQYFLDGEALRQNRLAGAKQAIAAERAKFDPKGTQAQRLAELWTRIDAEALAADATAKKTIFDQSLELRKQTFAEQKATADIANARSQTAQGWGRLKLDRERFKAEQGPKPVSPQDRKAEADANEAEGKLIVRDAITGKPLGRADNVDKAKHANEVQANWHALERNLKRMEILRNEIGTTVDNRILRGADNDKRVAEYNSLAAETANAIAKIDDPTSAIRDNERQAIIDERLPSYNTPTSKGPEQQEAKQKALRDSARAKVKAAMTAANIPFDPNSYYNDEAENIDIAPGDTPEVRDSKLAKEAMRAAGAYKPAAPVDESKGFEHYDPKTKQVIKTQAPRDTPLLGDLKTGASIGTLVELASRGNAEATAYLRAIASDAKHPEAANAAAALDTLGSK